MTTKELVKKYFDENSNEVSVFNDVETIKIGWTLGTSDEHLITELFTDDFGEEPNDGDWDVINDSIRDFDGAYRSILNNFGSAAYDEGHNSDGDLVGCVDVTVEQLANIIETGEFVYDNEIVFTSSSGTFNVEQLDLLHQSVLATLTFYIPTELV